MPVGLRAAAFALIALIAFEIANRGAYKGYFQDDDLDNLAFTSSTDWQTFARPLFTPQFFSNNFRPPGHLYYKLMGRAAGLSFNPYIAVIHGWHVIAIVLLWLLLRQLSVPPPASAAGILLLAFNMAVFDIYWKPMYVFDLLCGTFCLLSLLLWVKGRWILSLLAFWLAYRSKELAIMLPAVLLVYEFTLGGKRWKPLLPFFGISLLMGVQALIHQGGPETPYTLHFDPASIWKCLRFYASTLFQIPYAGVVVLLLPLAVRDRRVLWGVLAFCILLVPMLLLPGRLFSAYLYVPLIGLAVAFGAAASQVRPAALLGLLAMAWLSWNYVCLRRDRNIALAAVPDRRAYVSGLIRIRKEEPDIDNFIYDNGPVNWYGTKGVLQFLRPDRDTRFTAIGITQPDELRRALDSPPLAVLVWNQVKHNMAPLIRTATTAPASYIRMASGTPIWQLEQGWYANEGTFRWAAPLATVRLSRPPDATQFELAVNVGPDYLKAFQHNHVAVEVGGVPVGEQDFTTPGWHSVRWNVPPGPAGITKVTIQSGPEYRDPRSLGVAVGALGFK